MISAASTDRNLSFILLYKDLIFKYCDAHILPCTKIMNLQQQDQFFHWMTRVKANSRAASTTEDTIVTEMVDGLIVSKPAKRIEYIGETKAEPIVIDLQKSKAGSVPGINKLKAIHDFISLNGRRF
jgi:hypothetical protein